MGAIQMDKALWILNILSVIGAILNSNLHPRQLRSSYKIWIISNTGWCIAFAVRSMWPEFVLFLVYLLFSIKGFLKSKQNQGLQHVTRPRM